MPINHYTEQPIEGLSRTKLQRLKVSSMASSYYAVNLYY